MSRIFLIQLIVSFLVGGSTVALLSILAERLSERVAGIIISFPTTIAIGFFFIGWATSADKVAQAAVTIPAMEGAIMLFATTYLYLSKIDISKKWSMLLCTVGSLTAWFVSAFAVVEFHLSNLWLSLSIFVVFFVISYYLITMRPHIKSEKTFLKYTTFEKITRAIFAGGVITFAVFLSKTLGPLWGVIFSAFPAVYISTMTLVYWNYDKHYLFRVWKNSPVGAIVFVVYAISAIYTFPAFGLILGTLYSYILSVVFMLGLVYLPRKF